MHQAGRLFQGLQLPSLEKESEHWAGGQGRVTGRSRRTRVGHSH